ncbi:MAG: hypothetical protein ACP5GA_03360 [Acidithiobacillus sp.]
MRYSVQVKGKTYHSGLVWRSFEEKLTLPEVREIGGELDGFVGGYWLAVGARYLWGFATVETGSSYSPCRRGCAGLLALELAGRAPQLPFAFILRDRDRYSFLVLDSNRIPLPSSDIWHPSLESMQQALEPYALLFQSQPDNVRRLRVDTPPDGLEEGWGDLASFLEENPTYSFSNPRYISVRGATQKIWWAVGGLALAAAGAGAYFFMTESAPKASAPVTAWHPPPRVHTVVPARTPAVTPSGPVGVRASVLLQDCALALQLPAVINGSRADGISCAWQPPSAATATSRPLASGTVPPPAPAAAASRPLPSGVVPPPAPAAAPVPNHDPGRIAIRVTYRNDGDRSTPAPTQIPPGWNLDSSAPGSLLLSRSVPLSPEDCIATQGMTDVDLQQKVLQTLDVLQWQQERASGSWQIQTHYGPDALQWFFRGLPVALSRVVWTQDRWVAYFDQSTKVESAAQALAEASRQRVPQVSVMGAGAELPKELTRSLPNGALP